jgi:hypothetical protein
MLEAAQWAEARIPLTKPSDHQPQKPGETVQDLFHGADTTDKAVSQGQCACSDDPIRSRSFESNEHGFAPLALAAHPTR